MLKNNRKNSSHANAEPEAFVFSDHGHFSAQCYRRLEFNAKAATFAEANQKVRTGKPYIMLLTTTRHIKIDSAEDLPGLLKSVLSEGINNCPYRIQVYPDGGLKICDKSDFAAISIAKEYISEFESMLKNLVKALVEKQILNK